MRGENVMDRTQLNIEWQRSRCLQREIDGEVNRLVHRPVRKDNGNENDLGEPPFLSGNVRETRVVDEPPPIIPEVKSGRHYDSGERRIRCYRGTSNIPGNGVNSERLSRGGLPKPPPNVGEL